MQSSLPPNSLLPLRPLAVSFQLQQLILRGLPPRLSRPKLQEWTPHHRHKLPSHSLKTQHTAHNACANNDYTENVDHGYDPEITFEDEDSDDDEAEQERTATPNTGHNFPGRITGMDGNNNDIWAEAWNATPEPVRSTGMGDGTTGMSDEQVEFMPADNQPRASSEPIAELDEAAREQATSDAVLDEEINDDMLQRPTTEDEFKRAAAIGQSQANTSPNTGVRRSSRLHKARP